MRNVNLTSYCRCQVHDAWWCSVGGASWLLVAPHQPYSTRGMQGRDHGPGQRPEFPSSDFFVLTMSSSSPKLLPPSNGPRLIVYHQTFHYSEGDYHSLLPLLTNNTGVTHVIVAAIHLNTGPGNITLNDHRPDDKRYDQLWGEVNWLQGSGVKVLGMLGGAARGSYEMLSGSDENVCMVAGYSTPSLTLHSSRHTTPLSTP